MWTGGEIALVIDKPVTHIVSKFVGIFVAVINFEVKGTPDAACSPVLSLCDELDALGREAWVSMRYHLMTNGGRWTARSYSGENRSRCAFVGEGRCSEGSAGAVQ